MLNDNFLILSLALPQEFPQHLSTPKFQIGQTVRWAQVVSQDCGRVVGIIYAAEASVQALGYHYAVQLDPASPSVADGITSDWAFEDDLELLLETDALANE